MAWIGDGHGWIETATTNLSDPNGQLAFRYVKCLGHLRCGNLSCPHIECTGEYNEKYWEGSTLEVLIPSPLTQLPWKYILVCHLCKVTSDPIVLEIVFIQDVLCNVEGSADV